MKEHAEKERIMVQPTRMPISSLHLTNETPINLLLLYYMELGLVCKKILDSSILLLESASTVSLSAMNARRQGHENPNSSVVAETLKLSAKISYGYQVKDRSAHTVTNYLNNEKTHSAINRKTLERPNYTTNQLYQVELAKPEIQIGNQ